MTVYDIIFILLSGALLSATCVKPLLVLQQSSYKIAGVANWLKVTHYDLFVRYFGFAFFSFGATFALISGISGIIAQRISYLVFVLFAVIFIVTNRKSKVPLALTPRMRRLIMTNTLVCLGFAVGAWALSQTVLRTSAYSLLPLTAIFACLVSHVIMSPVECAIRKSFVRDASEEIVRHKANGLKIVGITGSYGKTTAKNMLCAMLSSKYRTCATPSSYNTPLGICRTVNDVLEDGDEFLIAEMGARHRGDIAELCAVAPPDYALITGVGTQHLQTFGSEENIALTKYELIEALGKGQASFNLGDEGARKLRDRAESEGVNVLEPITASEVETTAEGVRFSLTCGDETVRVRTALFGSYIPDLVASVATLAHAVGVPLCACARSVEKLTATPHRLERTVVGDRVIIDDSYNSNPKGAKVALGVLGAQEGVKIIVTPGLVELGTGEENANKEFGEQIAEVCDIAILVGRNATAIKSGALARGMKEEKIQIVRTLKEAQKLLSGITEKATVLFENDLPDNYG